MKHLISLTFFGMIDPNRVTSALLVLISGTLSTGSSKEIAPIANPISAFSNLTMPFVNGWNVLKVKREKIKKKANEQTLADANCTKDKE